MYIKSPAESRNSNCNNSRQCRSTSPDCNPLQPDSQRIQLQTDSIDPLQRIRALTVNVGGLPVRRHSPETSPSPGDDKSNPIMAMEKFVQSHMTNSSAR